MVRRTAPAVLAVLLAVGSCKGGCTRRVALGQACAASADCESGLVCEAGRCALSPAAARAMMEQAGTRTDDAERPAVGGQRVKVRIATAVDQVFAACQAHERLVGGGCSGGTDGENTRHLRSWPDGYSADDTLGARWFCLGSGRVNAFALCQDSPPPDPAPVTDAPPPGR